jgi:hypothetical protein
MFKKNLFYHQLMILTLLDSNSGIFCFYKMFLLVNFYPKIKKMEKKIVGKKKKWGII